MLSLLFGIGEYAFFSYPVKEKMPIFSFCEGYRFLAGEAFTQGSEPV
jgi:hypothetical protein